MVESGNSSSPAASATSSPSEASLACWITLPCSRWRLSKPLRECSSSCSRLWFRSELQFAGGERDQFSERSQFGLLDHSSLQPLEVVETLARMLEQLQQPLVQEVLFEENDKGQEGDAAHGHRKANLAQIKLVVAQEQCPISHDGEREQG